MTGLVPGLMAAAMAPTPRAKGTGTGRPHNGPKGSSSRSALAVTELDKCTKAQAAPYAQC